MEINAFRQVNIGKIRAVVDIRTAEGFIIKGFKVIEGENGLFVGMPSEKSKSGKYIDLVRTDSPELKEMLDMLIIDAFRQRVKSDD